MQYYVIGPDGNKYGPADVPTLKQWVAENRLGQQSMLEDFSSGQRLQAGQVPGLFGDAPTAAPTMGAPGPAMGAPTGAPYQPQYATPGNYPREMNDPNAGKTMIILSWVFSGIGVLCCPIIFSTLGIIFAVIAKTQGAVKWLAPLIGGIVSLVVGMAIGIAVQPMVQEWARQMQQQQR
jgi:hypothetical protein